MALTATTNLIISSLTIIGQLIIVDLLISFIARNQKFSNSLIQFFGKNALVFAFVVALIATVGSLFYSEIIGFEPCKLCWFQRIFMYPLPIIFGIALKKKDFKIKDYSIPLAVIGALIAAYHYLVQVFQFTTSCGADSEVPCNIVFSFELGYITIPMMALTAFILIIILMSKKST